MAKKTGVRVSIQIVSKFSDPIEAVQSDVIDAWCYSSTVRLGSKKEAQLYEMLDHVGKQLGKQVKEEVNGLG